MREITPEEAREKHSIWTVHHEMDPGGELRFRLLHADGTRYIRTERPQNAGGDWQDAHSHRCVQETYIVQRGWIAFAEEQDGDMSLRVLKEGAIVTTQPQMRHNVYMPAGSIIHTVKHGVGQGEDKEPAPEFNTRCRTLRSESAIHSFAIKSARSSILTGNKQTYSDEYRHFDSLIWQMPGWSTAIFLGSAAVLGQASVENIAKLLPVFTPSSLTTGFLLVIFSFLLGLTQALYRFRIHQVSMKTYTPTNWWSSASTHLQIYVTAQAFVVLYLALGSVAVSLGLAAILCMSAFLALVVYRERALRRHARASARRL